MMISSHVGLDDFKAVVAGPAGSASARPLFRPHMLSAVSLFAVSVAPVLLTCDLIPANHQKCRVLWIRISLTHVVACRSANYV